MSHSSAPALHTLPATPETVHWGFFDRSLRPVLEVRSGDAAAIEALTHHAGDAPDLLMDDGIRAVYEAVTDRGPGVHIMTGPIAVQGAEPGDTLEVRILQLRPRLLYGSNFAAMYYFTVTQVVDQRKGIHAAFVTPQLRAPNHISAFIAFLGLAAVALFLESLRARYVRGGWQRAAFGVALGALLLLGVADQTAPAFVPRYAATREQFGSDRAFVEAIEQRLPPGAMIFQLPDVPFPEALGVRAVGPYDLLRGYLHSHDLRWSFGSMKGRDHDWRRAVVESPAEAMLPRLAAVGYGGIYLGTTPVWLDEWIDVPPGPHVLRCVSTAAPVPTPPGDPRRLSFRVINFQLVDAAAAEVAG